MRVAAGTFCQQRLYLTAHLGMAWAITVRAVPAVVAADADVSVAVVAFAIVGFDAGTASAYV